MPPEALLSADRKFLVCRRIYILKIPHVGDIDDPRFYSTML